MLYRMIPARLSVDQSSERDTCFDEQNECCSNEGTAISLSVILQYQVHATDNGLAWIWRHKCLAYDLRPRKWRRNSAVTNYGVRTASTQRHHIPQAIERQSMQSGKNIVSTRSINDMATHQLESKRNDMTYQLKETREEIDPNCIQ